jgi:hypothetical protein
MSGRPSSGRRRRLALLALIAALVVSLAAWLGACDSSDESTTTSTASTGNPSGDMEAAVGETIKLGKVVILVRALDATFNPVTPEQRLSEQTPSAPSGDESFYQAYVNIQNKGASPVRVDAEDFACAVGSSVVGIEPTWSGPPARSLLKNSSLDLLVTFKAKAGYEPVLLYSPSWYDGTIRITPAVTTQTTQAP